MQNRGFRTRAQLLAEISKLKGYLVASYRIKLHYKRLATNRFVCRACGAVHALPEAS